MSGRGLFVVLEGVEGAGKSTQAKLLSEWMDELGVAHTLAREPGGTPVGEAIRDVLLGSREPELPPETELLLMLAARAAFVREIVRPALADGRIMLADRFELSSLAYQGSGRGLGVERVRELNAFATGGLRPDLTIVLDLSPEAGRARQSSAGKEADRIEGEGPRFHARVREAYAKLARDDPDSVLVDASPPTDEVAARVRALLTARFPEPFASGRG